MKVRASFAIVLLVVISAGVAHSRPVWIWNYSDLTEKSDVIIIGTHKKSVDSVTRTKLIGIPVAGINSTFNVLSVLKGEVSKKTIDVYHYRYDNVSAITNGFSFVRFDDDDENTYLIFLKKEMNGRFIAVSGQMDSVLSFKRIVDVPETLLLTAPKEK